jgi:hypothetical protein
MDMYCYVCKKQSTKMMYVGERPTSIVLYYCEHCYHLQLDNATFCNICEDTDLEMISYVSNPDAIMHVVKRRLEHEPYVKIKCNNTGVILNKKYRLFGDGQVSYFTTNSMKILCENEQLCLNKVDCDEYYNKTFEITLRCTEDTNAIESLVRDLEYDLYSNETYRLYAIEYEIYRNTIHNYILYNRYLTGSDYSHAEKVLMEYYGIISRV